MVEGVKADGQYGKKEIWIKDNRKSTVYLISCSKNMKNI